MPPKSKPVPGNSKSKSGEGASSSSVSSYNNNTNNNNFDGRVGLGDDEWDNGGTNYVHPHSGRPDDDLSVPLMSRPPQSYSPSPSPSPLTSILRPPAPGRLVPSDHSHKITMPPNDKMAEPNDEMADLNDALLLINQEFDSNFYRYSDIANRLLNGWTFLGLLFVFGGWSYWGYKSDIQKIYQNRENNPDKTAAEDIDALALFIDNAIPYLFAYSLILMSIQIFKTYYGHHFSKLEAKRNDKKLEISKLEQGSTKEILLGIQSIYDEIKSLKARSPLEQEVNNSLARNKAPSLDSTTQLSSSIPMPPSISIPLAPAAPVDLFDGMNNNDTFDHGHGHADTESKDRLSPPPSPSPSLSPPVSSTAPSSVASFNSGVNSAIIDGLNLKGTVSTRALGFTPAFRTGRSDTMALTDAEAMGIAKEIEGLSGMLIKNTRFQIVINNLCVGFVKRMGDARPAEEIVRTSLSHAMQALLPLSEFMKAAHAAKSGSKEAENAVAVYCADAAALIYVASFSKEMSEAKDDDLSPIESCANALAKHRNHYKPEEISKVISIDETTKRAFVGLKDPNLISLKDKIDKKQKEINSAKKTGGKQVTFTGVPDMSVSRTEEENERDNSVSFSHSQ